MSSLLPKIDPKKECEKIEKFIKDTLRKNNHQKVVIGLSGGIDSTTCFYLLKESVGLANIIISHLPYLKSSPMLNILMNDLKIPKENINVLSIRNIADAMADLLKINGKEDNKIRFGNIMARIRMIILFDLAKKNRAFVCGTENKSEYRLGYFTRYGDEASDLEPIQYLYKTQVYDLAKFLKVPREIINQSPTAGLWEGQTDEKELGFTYKEADQVLYLYFEKKMRAPEIKILGFKNAEKIINFALKNKFKHNVPYSS